MFHTIEILFDLAVVSVCLFIYLFHAECVAVYTTKQLDVGMYWIDEKVLISEVVHRFYFTSKSKQNTWKSISRRFFSHTVFLFFPQSNFSHSIFPRFGIEPHDTLLVYYNNDIYTFAIELTKVKRRNTNKVAKHTCELSTRQKRSDTTQKKREKKKKLRKLWDQKANTHIDFITLLVHLAPLLYTFRIDSLCCALPI